ncbi:MAG: flavodoxin family protein [Anaerovoracaceae bacterium]|jgi:flavodoxin
MNTAVRYYSRGGNTKAIAEAIAEGAGCSAESIPTALGGEVDVLYLGAAVYAGRISGRMKKFIASLDPGKVGKVVLFSTSMTSRRAFSQMEKGLRARGVPVEGETFYSKSKEVDENLEAAREFGSRFA